MPDLIAWAKAHQKPLMVAGAAGVAGIALVAGKANADDEPAEQSDASGNAAAAPYTYEPYNSGSFDSTAGDLYNDLQPELERIGDGLGQLDDRLDDLPEEIGKNIPRGRGHKHKHRPPKPNVPGGKGGGKGGVRHPPHHSGPPKGPKKGPKKGRNGTQPYDNGGRPIVGQSPTKRGGPIKQLGGRPIMRPQQSAQKAPAAPKLQPMPLKSAPIKAQAQAIAKKAKRK